MMDEKLKAKWVKALRSGEYNQGQGHLRRQKIESYCCLGVLADVIDPDGWSKPVDNKILYGWRGEENPGSLPYSLQKEIRISGHAGTLIDMNDHKLSSFNDIADYIEKNL
jgi:hypothetical protein